MSSDSQEIGSSCLQQTLLHSEDRLTESPAEKSHEAPQASEQSSVASPGKSAAGSGSQSTPRNDIGLAASRNDFLGQLSTKLQPQQEHQPVSLTPAHLAAQQEEFQSLITNVNGDLCIPVTTSSDVVHDHEHTDNLRAYKLGKNRWLYNEFRIKLITLLGATQLELGVLEATHKPGAVHPSVFDECRAKFSCRLSNFSVVTVHSYLVYDAPEEVLVEEQNPMAPPKTAFKWPAARREHCQKGCTGPILRPIQRYGRCSRRGSGRPSKQKSKEELVKDPRHLYLSIDEASTHVGRRNFRVIVAVYDEHEQVLLGTSMSVPIEVMANNDAPHGAAKVDIQVDLAHHWEGWRSQPSSSLVNNLSGSLKSQTSQSNQPNSLGQQPDGTLEKGSSWPPFHSRHLESEDSVDMSQASLSSQLDFIRMRALTAVPPEEDEEDMHSVQMYSVMNEMLDTQLSSNSRHVDLRSLSLLNLPNSGGEFQTNRPQMPSLQISALNMPLVGGLVPPVALRNHSQFMVGPSSGASQQSGRLFGHQSSVWGDTSQDHVLQRRRLMAYPRERQFSAPAKFASASAVRRSSPLNVLGSSMGSQAASHFYSLSCLPGSPNMPPLARATPVKSATTEQIEPALLPVSNVQNPMATMRLEDIEKLKFNPFAEHEDLPQME